MRSFIDAVLKKVDDACLFLGGILSCCVHCCFAMAQNSERTKIFWLNVSTGIAGKSFSIVAKFAQDKYLDEMGSLALQALQLS